MPQLSDSPVHIKLKLSALWASVMFCYLYADYFELYVPGKLESMQQGKMAPLGLGVNAQEYLITQELLLGVSILMAVPSLMVFLSIALPVRYNRILNIVFGTLLTLFLGWFTYMAGWYFYKFFAAIEAVLTALVVWHAWKWPRTDQ